MNSCEIFRFTVNRPLFNAPRRGCDVIRLRPRDSGEYPAGSLASTGRSLGLNESREICACRTYEYYASVVNHVGLA